MAENTAILTAMKFSSIQPSLHLRPYVRHYWILENGLDEIGQSFRCVPDGFIEASFQLRDPWVWGYNNEMPHIISKTKLIGQFSQSLEMTLPSLSKNLYVKFYPWGFYTLFGLPLDELTDRHISLDAVFGNEIATVHEALVACTELSDMKVVLENWLNKRLYNPTTFDPESVKIAHLICQHPESVKVKDILTAYPKSQRWLQKEFLKLTGLTPKYFARIRRHLKAAKELKTADNLTDLSYRLGFSDQAHFIHDFKFFSGFTPKVYAKRINPDGEFNNCQI